MPSNSGLGRADTVRYSLHIEGREPVYIPEPINYDDGNGNTYERDDKSKGVIITKKNTSEYHGEGYETLSAIFETDGIIPDVREVKEIKDPDRLDERWTPISETYIDTSKMEETGDNINKVIKTGTVEGGLKREIDSVWNEKYDLTKETSEDEIDIGKPDTITVQMDSREIFLRSVLKVEDGVEVGILGSEGLAATAIPWEVDSNSDEGNVNDTYGSDKLSAANNYYAALIESRRDSVFYKESDRKKEITITGGARVVQSGNLVVGQIQMDLIRYTGEDFQFGEVIESFGTANLTQAGWSLEAIFTKKVIELEEGDSLALALLSNGSDGIRYAVYDAELIIEEDSISEPSTTRAFLPKDLFARLIANATGKTGRFKSNLFETGKWSLLAVAPIWWIRQFPDIVNEGGEEERRIQATTSLQDAFDSYSAVEPLAWWPERVGADEVMRIELLSYTQQNFIGIHYGTTGAGLVEYLEVQNLTSKTLPDNFFKTITVGAEIGGDGYEEVQGLQSVGGQATFKTILTKGTTDYVKLSKYAMAAEYAEIPRRKPYQKFPDEDTRYDSAWQFLDLKIVNDTYRLRKWQDDFETVPTGIYRPDSAWNLRLTPAQCLLRHDFIMKAGLYHVKYANKNIRWISSDCNSSLITKKAGEDELVEDGLINHTRLGQATIIPKLDEFNLEVDYDIEKQITGTTLINGEYVPNWFGLVAYKKNGVVNYGRLTKVDTNKSGTHEIVQAFIR